MKATTLFTDFLATLGVPHTVDYSDRQFGAMPFQSMFGLIKLLERYNVSCEALVVEDKSELSKISTPFIADTPFGFVIVTSVSGDTVEYLTQGEAQTMALDAFTRVWNGIVLLAFPTKDSREPDYSVHLRFEIIAKVKRWLLWACVAALGAYLVITNGLWRSWSTIGIIVVDVLGLVLTTMLVQKTLKIKNKAADAVCGVLEKGGCDSILELKASSFFGIVKWSVVGFTYFSVSLLALLIFPGSIHWLALCNVYCLPFTLWSIWYQKFRARRWCTLCVSVQASLWLLFGCYFGGGWLTDVWPLQPAFFLLGVVYLTVLLALDRVLPAFDKTENNYADD